MVLSSVNSMTGYNFRMALMYGLGYGLGAHNFMAGLMSGGLMFCTTQLVAALLGKPKDESSKRD